MKLADWRQHWNPRAYWKDTNDFLAYRDELVARTLRVVAEWRHQRPTIAKHSKNLAFLCGRLELLVDECEANHLLPEPSHVDLETLAHELADFLSVLPESDCWDRHPPIAARGEDPPPVCDGCPFTGPVKGLSGNDKYYGCDTLVFFGWKLIDHRAGLPRDAWPEPGVWYSAFETNPRRH